MMFAALTSAYLVRKGAGNWLEFHLPSPFYFSTGAIILSSITLYFSSVWLKEAKFGLYKLGLILTFLPNKVSEKRLFRLKLTSQYWHFVGLLWVYLLIFFYIEQP
jgi:heme/copper-type cytochrome/quinol oxidase subunit 3